MGCKVLSQPVRTCGTQSYISKIGPAQHLLIAGPFVFRSAPAKRTWNSALIMVWSKNAFLQGQELAKSHGSPAQHRLFFSLALLYLTWV